MKSTTDVSKIKSEFSLQNATSFGGVKIFLAYLEKIKLAEAMQDLSGGKAHNAIFPVHRILLYLIIGWTLGCERMFHFRKLQHDALLRRFLGGRWYAEDIAIQLYYLLYVFGEDSKSERKVQYELFIEHFEQGYTEDGRRLPDGWKNQLSLFLRLREIIVVVGMYRSWDLRQPDDWTRDFLQDSRMRIINGISLIDDFL
ncbi:hypothetical protein SK3146_05776 [Paenibacillus konkukensis]|uniref:Uncharacterized protein n=1 Tax=Paenibacillus konkukensis TaxID=2020716 RepID=A0ABY4RWV6_9BACL|nr:hypothetical protein [Paenibacillus konkukensis]UQZ86483.1 hypothetical protein SK3146_05776 [Paenibacillus konkukensis]